MKKCLKFLVGLFLSTIFVVNVNASIYSDYSSEFKYDEIVQEKINNNKERYDNLIDYIKNTFNTQRCSIENKECLISIDLSTIDTDTWLVSFDDLKLSDTDSVHPFIRNYYSTSSSSFRKMYMQYFYTSYKFNFNSENEIVSYASSSFNQHFYQYAYDTLNPLENDVTLLISDYYFITDFINENITIPFNVYDYNSKTYEIPIKLNDIIYIPNTTINALEFFESLGKNTYAEPTYTYEVEPADNGKYKINFKFENYDDENTNYRFSLIDKFSQESFGVENSYKNSCFFDIEDLYNTIPIGNEYSIEVENSSILELKLYQYEQVGSCYEEIEIKNELIDVNNINNSAFETEPNFVVDRIEYNTLTGHFENLGSFDNSLNTCYYNFSNNLDNKNVFDCREKVDIHFEHNGYISISLARGNMVLYNRKINVSGGSIDKPKILYDIENYVGYSNIVWSINNQSYSDNIAYRYSINNGLSYSEWTLITVENFEEIIKVTQSNNVILEIKDNETNEVYDSVVIVINVGYSSTLIDNVDMDSYQNLIGYLPPGPVDTILNLPLTLLKSLLKSLGGVCNPVKVPLPYVDTEIELPCQTTFYEKIGASVFFEGVGYVASTIMLYSYFIYLYKWIDKIMHLERIEVMDWGARL